MSAQDFGVVTIVLPNPQYDPSNGARIVNESFGFALRASGLIRTLSPNNPRHYDTIQGLLYVPELPLSTPCDNSTSSLIPANVTTRADIPPGDYPLIAIAPWTDPACVLSYLSVMRSDEVRGAVFFHPNNDSAQPPPVSDPSWSLQDGGQWKSANDYPVYAIPGMVGAFLLDELAQYSGNISQVPYGNELEQIYDLHDTVRLYARMDVDSSNGIPSLWVFLIIVLAILLAVVLTTSVIMHLVQRRQRRQLQRRVVNGEVDLEALGIKRLKVPQELLDKMPQYTYISKTEPNNTTAEDDADKVTRPESKESNNEDVSNSEVREILFTQSTCPICLDDFVHGETTVRELPCNHIFHPECIDPFLRDNSSLCPMCKKSALPIGYCPVEVTNIMVRRERLMRRVAQRAVPGALPNSSSHRLSAPIVALNRTVRNMSRHPTYPSPEGGRATGSEMRSTEGHSDTRAEEEIPAEVRAQGVSARRAWLRERFARQQERSYDERADEARAVDVSRPLWRRIAGRVIPSLE
ncbi:uncharacterized protein Z518_01842 [Rhinocladiella mackenziei CBS 650.93]|uniref:RING-type domain-containing protein n=1 Tax=Rhinocladiella mackenziei CBS 650.93 TaxID=1442369 RepID=A0A0D2IN02_9EURO|nr:uncharacterized protein Z518_01842 [Rhinocladiella mackenziei CBS 650.93]KIX07189.1 hypothetical protein Z518_01842 [Rhinocladiella mackenziei CBS 650.93]